ncbi:uncharacterized protein LOC114467193 isoform X2 [Gouania willdenowi]|uniref:uncharacterized protein LOC114467193 isoform X2 n=1 Tax=Gouania willdenowi TaxID=441366 RepID=UPI001055A682|nr:uncharacterized protein LOC114467193 isoform X2 [Gouania willdenowi]
MPQCIITQCINRYKENSNTEFFKVPSWTESFERRRLWAQAIREAGCHAHWWTAHICSAHFKSVSQDVDNDDFVPSVFTPVRECVGHIVHNKESKESKKGERVKRGNGRRLAVQPMQRQRKQGMVQETETVTEEAKIETKTEAFCPQTKCSLSSITNPAGITELSGKKSIVHLKRLITAAGCYRCEKCCQTFTIASQLVKHILLHEGPEESFMCEVCGEQYSSRADFTDHQANHPKIEPGFICNICHKNFSTPQNLENHKLLHFKDYRRCFKCGVKFCHIHNPSSLRPQAEAERANEKVNKVQTHQIQEQKSPEKTEPNQKEELLKNVVLPSKAPPALLLQLSSHPPILVWLPPLFHPAASPFPFCLSPPHPLPSPSVNMSQPNASEVAHSRHEATSGALHCLTAVDDVLPLTTSPPPQILSSAQPGKAFLDFDDHDNAPDVDCDKGSQIKERYDTPEGQTSATADAHHNVLSATTRKTEINSSQDNHTPSTPKETDTLMEKEATLLQSTAASSLSSVTYSTVITELSRRKPVVLLKRLIPSAGGYQCEKCCQTFTSTSLLVQHMSQHEGKSSVTSELSVTNDTSQADLTDHQMLNQLKMELCFPCNICDRSFTTPQKLKRHKLLHVRDCRKCLKCGVIFCRRHNHVAFLPKADIRVEDEEELPVSKAQSLLPSPPLTSSFPPTSSIPIPKPNVPVVARKTLKRRPKLYLNVRPEPHSLNTPPLPEPLLFPDQAGTFPKVPEAPFGFSSLPSALKMFSPECLTSAFFKVQRNYQHIASNPKPCKMKREVKEEQPEQPPPRKPRTKKVQRIAYDLEFIL